MNIPNPLVTPPIWLRTVLLIIFGSAVCLGHNQDVHREITAKAFESSEGVVAFLSDYLGSQHAPFRFQPFLKSEPPPLEGNYWGHTPYGWLVEGSYYEDMTFYGNSPLKKEWRCLNHFYVPWPVPDGLTDESDSPWIFMGYFPGGITHSFIWATSKGMAGISGVPSVSFVNNETWVNAREFQYESLTLSTSPDIS